MPCPHPPRPRASWSLYQSKTHFSGAPRTFTLTTRLPVHPSGLTGCILVFRNEETATWAGGETTEAGDPEGQELEFAAATLYLGNPALPPPHPPEPPIAAWSSEGPSERGGRGHERPVCLFIISAHRSPTGAVSSETAGKPLLGFEETIPPKHNGPTVPIPPEVKGKAVVRVTSLGKRQF